MPRSAPRIRIQVVVPTVPPGETYWTWLAGIEVSGHDAAAWSQGAYGEELTFVLHLVGEEPATGVWRRTDTVAPQGLVGVSAEPRCRIARQRAPTPSANPLNVGAA